MTTRRRSIAVAVGLVACGMLVATAYAAASSSENDHYSGCVNVHSGVLRMIDPGPGGQCHTGLGPDQEEPIQWRPADGQPASTGQSSGSLGAPDEHLHPTKAPTGAGHGTTVITRRDSAPLPATGQVTVFAKCKDNEIPVNGYPLVDGEDLYGNPKASYSVNDTGEREEGFKLTAFPPYNNPYAAPGSLFTAPGKEVTAVVRCLVLGS